MASIQCPSRRQEFFPPSTPDSQCPPPVLVNFKELAVQGDARSTPCGPAQSSTGYLCDLKECRALRLTISTLACSTTFFSASCFKFRGNGGLRFSQCCCLELSWQTSQSLRLFRWNTHGPTLPADCFRKLLPVALQSLLKVGMKALCSPPCNPGRGYSKASRKVHAGQVSPAW